MNNINKENLFYGVYCRKSSDSEDKQVQSIETQQREMYELADRFGLKCNEAARYEESRSAFVVGRLEFEKMINDIEAGRINAILVLHPNRLARNVIDGGRIIDLIDRGKLKEIRTPAHVFRNNATEKFMLGIEFIISKKDSDDKSSFVKNGQKTKAIKGYPHGLSAIGFINDKTEEKGNRKWFVDDTKFPLVKHLFELFLTGTWSANKLGRHARTELKLTTPKHKKTGNVLIAISAVHTMLRNPIYAGFFYQAGERYELNASLPRIITEEQHYKILRMLASKNIPKTKKHVTTYTGFVQSDKGDFVGPDMKFQVICDCKKKFCYSHRTDCPKCGKLIVDMDSPKYLEYVYYYNISLRKKSLPTKSVTETDLQKFTVDYFMENVQLSPALAEWSKKYLHELKDKELEVQRVVSSNTKNEAETAEKRKKKIIQMMADDTISAEDGKKALADLNKTISSSRNHTPVPSDWFDIALDLTDLTKEFVDTMQSDDVKSKRVVLSRLGSNLIWNEEKVSITNTKWMNILIEGLKEAKLKNPKFEPRFCEADKDKTEVFASVRPTLLRRQGSNL